MDAQSVVSTKPAVGGAFVNNRHPFFEQNAPALVVYGIA